MRQQISLGRRGIRRRGCRPPRRDRPLPHNPDHRPPPSPLPGPQLYLLLQPCRELPRRLLCHLQVLLHLAGRLPRGLPAPSAHLAPLRPALEINHQGLPPKVHLRGPALQTAPLPVPKSLSLGLQLRPLGPELHLLAKDKALGRESLPLVGPIKRQVLISRLRATTSSA